MHLFTSLSILSLVRAVCSSMYSVACSLATSRRSTTKITEGQKNQEDEQHEHWTCWHETWTIPKREDLCPRLIGRHGISLHWDDRTWVVNMKFVKNFTQTILHTKSMQRATFFRYEKFQQFHRIHTQCKFAKLMSKFHPSNSPCCLGKFTQLKFFLNDRRSRQISPPLVSFFRNKFKVLCLMTWS